MHPALERFSPATREWFAGALGEPTTAQAEAWEAIAAGGHALVVAPTGSGKTLAAFLWALDRLAAERRPERAGTRVLYVSPLKALGVDVERNLRAPLDGIRREAARLGTEPPRLRVGVRSGDTAPADRRGLLRHPPDVLITTPESLYLMLTSRARETLAGVETVIVDEIHAVAATKRGAHLALSLERLDALLARPAQRIGLSATVRPVEEVARFLGGAAPVRVVAPAARKELELRVVIPVEDLRELPPAPGDADPAPTAGSIWPHVEEAVADEVLAHRSTIVFANSRRLAERLTARLNEIVEQRGMPEPVARAHHGSVSKEQRAEIEDALKSGRLRCVVATSSLELGIDMGAVDLVVQVEAPPSVASGLQRIGRAGHGVGEVSRGVLFPKQRADLLRTAVVAERMRAGLIEAIAVPQNPLDVLAQQTVAAAAGARLDVEEWFATVRRSAPFAILPRSAFDAVLDLLAGRYPSDEFAGLRPSIVWDRAAGAIEGRPGAQRLAVTSGGTIPDRGLFGVFLSGDGDGPRRVGELDEEMVYESRIGDVIALGATSWRIDEITPDRVLVSPAPGRTGRVPFWHGDALGRPAELGAAMGAFAREVAAGDGPGMRDRLARAGLDAWAIDNLLGYVADQRRATGVVPSDEELVVERFRDELGDWRVILHSPYGMPVHAPWALAVGERARERLGVDAHATASDDGIVLRIPDSDAPPPGVELFRFDPDELESVVTAAVGGSALFAARFRENAARSLLMPTFRPDRRSPLWQQRQRGAQLLEVAREHPRFPVVLETVREVLQDVYDLRALLDLAARIADRRVRLAEVETASPSPFASTLLFGYVAAFMYEGDAPLAERRAAALSLDPAILAELLGRAELRELLDPEAVARVERELQRLDRPASDAEGVADLLRLVGPLSLAELADRTTADAAGALAELGGRVIPVAIAGEERWAAVEDAPRLRDALGARLPDGIPAALLEPVADPVGDLVGRELRSHATRTAAEIAVRLGLGRAVVEDALRRLEAARRAMPGELRPGGESVEWADPEVLRRLRSRSLAALRAEVEPVPQRDLARFLVSWQRADGSLRGVDGVLQVVEQLAGVPLPASAWESLVLPARVRDYSPALLDELTTTGEVLWSGRGELASGDGWIALHPAAEAPLTLTAPRPLVRTELHERVLDALAGGGAFFFRQLSGMVGSASPDGVVDDARLAEALWDLAWAGLVGNDSLAPLRARLSGSRTRGTPRGRVPGARARARAAASLVAAAPPTVAGRWSALPEPAPATTEAAAALATRLLDRHGVVTRGAVVAEEVPGGFAQVYRVLAGFEEAGRVRRGRYVAGLGAAQFASPATVDRLRATAPGGAVTLAATDPANAYGAALPWPESAAHRPARKAGALVTLVDGALALYVERGGRTVLSFPSGDGDASLGVAALSLAETARRAGIRLRVETADGGAAMGTPLGDALEAAGFARTPQGLRLR